MRSSPCYLLQPNFATTEGHFLPVVSCYMMHTNEWISFHFPRKSWCVGVRVYGNKGHTKKQLLIILETSKPIFECSVTMWLSVSKNPSVLLITLNCKLTHQLERMHHPKRRDNVGLNKGLELQTYLALPSEMSKWHLFVTRDIPTNQQHGQLLSSCSFCSFCWKREWFSFAF